MPTHVIGEGDIDRAVIESLGLRTAGAPVEILPKQGKGHQGRNEAMQTAVDLCRTIGGKTIVLALDLNGRSAAQLQAELQAMATWEAVPGVADAYFRLTGNRVRLVPLGLPGHPVIAGLGFQTFSMDDYLVALVHDPATYAALANAEAHLPGKNLSHAQVLAAITATIQLWATSHAVHVNSSKRYLDLVRALIGFGGARASFAQRLISRADPSARAAVLGPVAAAISTD